MDKYAGLTILHIDNDIANDHKRLIVELFAVIFYFHSKDYLIRAPPPSNQPQNILK